VDERSFKFKHLVASEIENNLLSSNHVKYLANQLNIKLYPRPLGLPEEWPVTLCKSFLSQKYINPLDTSEWLVVLRPDAYGKLPYIIHRTSIGFADARWFYEVVPQLASIVKDPSFGRPFSMSFNENINKMFASERNGKGMTTGQIQAINLFFQKYVPGVESICTTCFKVMLPRSGAGERWLHEAQNGEKYEVRLSAAKPMGQTGQRREYISQTIIDKNQAFTYALWDPKKCNVEYSDDMKQEGTHIPWTIYDYSKFNIGMPICRCKQKSKTLQKK
jgi:hypothetical protein